MERDPWVDQLDLTRKSYRGPEGSNASASQWFRLDKEGLAPNVTRPLVQPELCAFPFGTTQPKMTRGG